MASTPYEQISQLQLSRLEEEFSKNPTLGRKRRMRLSKDLGLPANVLKYWFEKFQKNRNRPKKIVQPKLHPVKKIPFTCRICHKVFQSYTGMNGHYLKNHDPNARVYTCATCPDFRSLHSSCLRRHLANPAHPPVAIKTVEDGRTKKARKRKALLLEIKPCTVVLTRLSEEIAPRKKMKYSDSVTLGPISTLADKGVKEIPGIGEEHGKRLEEMGFDKAFVVLGQFLVLKKNEDLFLEWLKDTAGISTNNARQCNQWLEDWCSAFLYLFCNSLPYL